MPTNTIQVTVPVTRAGWLAAGFGIGLVLAALLAPALAPHGTLAVNPAATPNEQTISVSGTGRVIISPDIADVSIGVTAVKPTVKAARAAAAASMTAVIAALKKVGIADADIQTTTLSLQPSYDYSSNQVPPRITGYSLSNQVAVTVRNLDKIGDVIDSSLAAGATSVDGVTFRVNDPAAAESQARQQAMTQARAKAQTLASAAGVSIAGVASISEASSTTPPPVYYDKSMAAGAAPSVPTPIQAGTNEVDVTVSVVYVIN